jgi:hypothetical protein
MSFRDIGVIINKWKEREKGLEQNDDIKSKSKTNQAIKTTVDVVIALDLPADQVRAIYRQYWDPQKPSRCPRYGRTSVCAFAGPLFA